jgi:hypothetical protein
MNNQNPYEQLEVTEDSSFEEIQTARDRLFVQHQGNQKQLEAIEAAYDAVLMQRLRMRQEGKIKVPEGIRFPEKIVQPPTNAVPVAQRVAPAWLQGWIDTPTPADIWLPAGILASLSTVVVLISTPNALQLALLAAVGSSFYFLYRKERKFGRSVLLTLLGLIFGFLVGGLLNPLVQAQLASLGLSAEIFVSVFTFLILWLFSSFLK